MERFGPVVSLRLVRDSKTGKSRGYAFVEFKHQRHCDKLYDASGMKIDGKRILVDYEQARVSKDWLPRRLGGGKGNKRKDRDAEHKIRKVLKEYKEGKDRKEDQKQQKSKQNETPKHSKVTDAVMEDQAASTKGEDGKLSLQKSSSDAKMEVKREDSNSKYESAKHEKSYSGKHKRDEKTDIPQSNDTYKRYKVDEESEIPKPTIQVTEEPIAPLVKTEDKEFSKPIEVPILEPPPSHTSPQKTVPEVAVKVDETSIEPHPSTQDVEMPKHEPSQVSSEPIKTQSDQKKDIEKSSRRLSNQE